MATLLIAGSRGFDQWNKERMFSLLTHASQALDLPFSEVIHGGARGVDRMGGEWAEAQGYEVTVYPADWDGLGKRAGFVRNQIMVNKADAAIIVWDGTSPGTEHTLRSVKTKRIPYVLLVRKPG